MQEPTTKQDSRYPYTYACDYIRCFGGYGPNGVKVNRSDAGSMIGAVAAAMGTDKEALAILLADYYLANKKQVDKEATEELMRNLFVSHNRPPFE